MTNIHVFINEVYEKQGNFYSLTIHFSLNSISKLNHIVRRNELQDLNNIEMEIYGGTMAAFMDYMIWGVIYYYCCIFISFNSLVHHVNDIL